MLRVTLHISSTRVADYEVKRVTGITSRPNPEDRNWYEVRSIPDMTLLGTVEHRYQDPVEVLATEALRIVTTNAPYHGRSSSQR